MSSWIRVATTTCLLLLAAALAACTVDDSIDKAFQGTWNCSIVTQDESMTVTVKVNDGTYQVSGLVSGQSFADAGTWRRSGDTLTVTSDSEGVLKVLGAPGEVGKSMSMRLQHEDDDPESVTATFDDGTLRFGFKRNRYTCTKGG